MFQSVGLWLTTLHREKIGPLTIENLNLTNQIGNHVHLNSNQIELLWNAVGGIESCIEEKLELLKHRAESQNDEYLQSWLKQYYNKKNFSN